MWHQNSLVRKIEFQYSLLVHTHTHTHTHARARARARAIYIYIYNLDISVMTYNDKLKRIILGKKFKIAVRSHLIEKIKDLLLDI